MDTRLCPAQDGLKLYARGALSLNEALQWSGLICTLFILLFQLLEGNR
jgi:hypothetical protein